MARSHDVSTIAHATVNVASERLLRALDVLRLNSQPAQQAALLEYLSQLMRWNKTYNLTAIRDPDQALVHHIFDSLSLVAPLSRALSLNQTETPTVVDVGSGGGLPGVILAIMLPGVHVTCVDAVEKKTMFVRQMAGVLALPNLTARHARIEALKPLQATLVTSRAFASLEDFAKLAGPHAREDGYLVAMKGREPTEELTALQAHTNWFAQAIEPLTVPEFEGQRCLVWLQRKGNT
jgi:16S rRNA (guanine527-N7)-methyltransferase